MKRTLELEAMIVENYASSTNAKTDDFLQHREPVVSVDTKKKELVGDFKKNWQEWQPEGGPEQSRVCDLPQDEAEKRFHTASMMRAAMKRG